MDNVLPSFQTLKPSSSRPSDTRLLTIRARVYDHGNGAAYASLCLQCCMWLYLNQRANNDALCHAWTCELRLELLSSFASAYQHQHSKLSLRRFFVSHPKRIDVHVLVVMSTPVDPRYYTSSIHIPTAVMQ